jgi:hypothetical protein
VGPFLLHAKYAWHPCLLEGARFVTKGLDQGSRWSWNERPRKPVFWWLGALLAAAAKCETSGTWHTDLNACCTRQANERHHADHDLSGFLSLLSFFTVEKRPRPSSPCLIFAFTICTTSACNTHERIENQGAGHNSVNSRVGPLCRYGTSCR